MATGLAILFLGERVTLPIFVGTLVIVLGTTLLSLSGKYVGFPVRYLLYPVLSASCFGVVAIGIVKLTHRETITRRKGRGVPPYSPLTPPFRTAEGGCRGLSLLIQSP
jgi:drug/metabolite transporter (DMT)-like permease